MCSETSRNLCLNLLFLLVSWNDNFFLSCSINHPFQVAVCNLASLALPMYVKADKTFDFVKLAEVTKVITRNLNKIIEVNYYPVIEVSFPSQNIWIMSYCEVGCDLWFFFTWFFKFYTLSVEDICDVIKQNESELEKLKTQFSIFIFIQRFFSDASVHKYKQKCTFRIFWQIWLASLFIVCPHFKAITLKPHQN